MWWNYCNSYRGRDSNINKLTKRYSSKGGRYESNSYEYKKQSHENFYKDYFNQSSYYNKKSSNYNDSDKKIPKQMYKTLAMKFHTDKNENSDESIRVMQIINNLKEEWRI